MALVKTLAIIVRTIDWRDTSKVATLFTRELGRIDVIAKGARSIKSQFSGILETINLIEAIIYVSARRELQILGKVTLENSYPSIRSDLEKTAISFSINELIYMFLKQENIDQNFFDFVKNIFFELQKAENSELILWYFMLKFASYLGFKPEFRNCRRCGKLNRQKALIFVLKEGGVVCNRCQEFEGNHYIMTSSVQEFFIELQQMSEHKVSSLTYSKYSNFSYTDFLLDYLSYHTDQKIRLKSLKLLN